MIQLRPYQLELIDNVNSALEQHRSVLAQLATGGGKSVILATVVDNYIKLYRRPVLVIAHRTELIMQLKSTLLNITHRLVGVVKAGYPYESLKLVQVASIQSLNEKRIGLMENNKPCLIIIDEAHHTTDENRYSQLFSQFDCPILGLTATPVRLGKKKLGDCYEKLICGVTAKQLIREGFLCKYKLFVPKESIIAGKTRNGVSD